jgi:protein-S-isoprenylcysteine O-methyltransferase Ste14
VGVLALVLIVVWLLIVGGLRGYLLSRRTGDVGVHARDPAGSPQWWSKLISALAVLAGIGAAVAAIDGMAPIPPLGSPVVAVVGVALTARDRGNRRVTAGDGRFVARRRRSRAAHGARDLGAVPVLRNPILTSTFVTGLGIVLVVPNVLALLMVVGIAAAEQIHVRLVEEPYLMRVHGEAYRRYAASTGRFVPGIGRLSAQTR